MYKRGKGFAGGLESVTSCPVCGSSSRSPLVDGLEDAAFQAVSGFWTFKRCNTCGTGYLDPRLKEDVIAVAYAGYHTHGGNRAYWRFKERPDRLRRRLTQRARNGYLNRVFGHRLRPASRSISLLANVSPLESARAEFAIRHLPSPIREPAYLLDVGCGSGEFLSISKLLGYVPEGVEPDLDAAREAEKHGSTIYKGNLLDCSLTSNRYAHVTMSHVVEHLHEPGTALKKLFDALEPGGRIWIQTPNLNSQGFLRFGKFWRGLEPPRHLCLFTPNSLDMLLRNVGFTRRHMIPPPPQVEWFFRQSYLLERGISPYSEEGRRGEKMIILPESKRLERNIRRNPSVAETVTFVAYKPHRNQ